MGGTGPFPAADDNDSKVDDRTLQIRIRVTDMSDPRCQTSECFLNDLVGNRTVECHGGSKAHEPTMVASEQFGD